MPYVYNEIEKQIGRLPHSLMYDLFVDAKTIDKKVFDDDEVYLVINQGGTKQMTRKEYKTIYKDYICSDLLFVVKILRTINPVEYVVKKMSYDEFVVEATKCMIL